MKDDGAHEKQTEQYMDDLHRVGFSPKYNNNPVTEMATKAKKSDRLTKFHFFICLQIYSEARVSSNEFEDYLPGCIISASMMLLSSSAGIFIVR
jgi:hypothetical protein